MVSVAGVSAAVCGRRADFATGGGGTAAVARGAGAAATFGAAIFGGGGAASRGGDAFDATGRGGAGAGGGGVSAGVLTDAFGGTGFGGTGRGGGGTAVREASRGEVEAVLGDAICGFGGATFCVAGERTFGVLARGVGGAGGAGAVVRGAGALALGSDRAGFALTGLPAAGRGVGGGKSGGAGGRAPGLAAGRRATCGAGGGGVLTAAAGGALRRVVGRAGRGAGRAPESPGGSDNCERGGSAGGGNRLLFGAGTRGLFVLRSRPGNVGGGPSLSRTDRSTMTLGRLEPGEYTVICC